MFAAYRPRGSRPAIRNGPAAEKKVTYCYISIENGSLDFLDLPNEKKHTVRELAVGIPFLSNIPSYVERFVQPHFSAKIDDALYTLGGRTKPFAHSRQTYLDVDIKNLDLPRYAAYLPLKTNFKLLAGSMDLGARISFVETKEKKASLSVSGSLSLRKIAVSDEKQAPFFQLPLLQVSIAPSEPLMRAIHLSAATIESPELDIRRDKRGALNVQSLLSPRSEAAPTSKEKAAPFSLEIDEVRLELGKAFIFRPFRRQAL